MNVRGMGCALSIHQKECRKSLGCALYIGARYLPENAVFKIYHWATYFDSLTSHLQADET
jgi:hypothetical protein